MFLLYLPPSSLPFVVVATLLDGGSLRDRSNWSFVPTVTLPDTARSAFTVKTEGKSLDLMLPSSCVNLFALKFTCLETGSRREASDFFPESGWRFSPILIFRSSFSAQSHQSWAKTFSMKTSGSAWPSSAQECLRVASLSMHSCPQFPLFWAEGSSAGFPSFSAVLLTGILSATAFEGRGDRWQQRGARWSRENYPFGSRPHRDIAGSGSSSEWEAVDAWDMIVECWFCLSSEGYDCSSFGDCGDPESIIRITWALRWYNKSGPSCFDSSCTRNVLPQIPYRSKCWSVPHTIAHISGNR